MPWAPHASSSPSTSPRLCPASAMSATEFASTPNTTCATTSAMLSTDAIAKARPKSVGGHDDAPTDFGRAFAIASVLNIALVVAQVVFGVLANSVALIADAGHNLGDVLGLLLAWGAHGMARWQPTQRYTYGFRSASILVALFNGIILMVATGAIAWEALRRLARTAEVG